MNSIPTKDRAMHQFSPTDMISALDVTIHKQTGTPQGTSLHHAISFRVRHTGFGRLRYIPYRDTLCNQKFPLREQSVRVELDSLSLCLR